MSNNDNFIKQYNNEIYAKTKKYQKIYGFEIGKGEHDTWNNEADAIMLCIYQQKINKNKKYIKNKPQIK